MIQSAYHFADSQHVRPGLVIKTYCFPSVSLPYFPPLCLPHLHFCWLLCTINISCVMWLFWIVWACVCVPVSPAHTYVRASAYSMCVRARLVFVCRCRSIKFCSHSCRLVSVWLWSVCLPLNLQPLLLFHSLSSEFFICMPLLFIPPLLSLYLLFLCSTAFFCLSRSMPSLSLPLRYPPPPPPPFSCYAFNLFLHSFTSLSIFPITCGGYFSLQIMSCTWETENVWKQKMRQNSSLYRPLNVWYFIKKMFWESIFIFFWLSSKLNHGDRGEEDRLWGLWYIQSESLWLDVSLLLWAIARQQSLSNWGSRDRLILNRSDMQDQVWPLW